MLQVYLPKYIFPSIVILTDTFKFGIICLILFIYIWLYGFKPGPAYVYLPLLLTAEFILIVAISFFTAAITPFFPDLTIVIQHVLQIMFFVSGVFFNLDSLSPKLQFWLSFNPMAILIFAFRGILMENKIPDVQGPLLIAIVSMVVILLSYTIMNKYDRAYPRMVS
jgi:lipopolysaccharide transport system permease protein